MTTTYKSMGSVAKPDLTFSKIDQFNKKSNFSTTKRSSEFEKNISTSSCGDVVPDTLLKKQDMTVHLNKSANASTSGKMIWRKPSKPTNTDFKVTSKKRKYDYKEKPNKECESTEIDSTQKLIKAGQKLKTPYFGLSVQKILGENFDCDYIQLLNKMSADTLYKQCEEEIEYFTGDLAKVKVSYGDTGLTYKFSGNNVPALPWPLFLKDLRDHLQSVTGVYFSFVLVNRYADGNDYIGEHKDDEKDMNELSPIASISLGQTRLFRFRHGDTRRKNNKRSIKPVTVDLEHGTLLMMNYPTNKYWYHSLPKSQSIKQPRINLTFRDIKK
ncbi:DNA oxidative demethylase ALKBH2-like isoform X2 [Antedon mediterranea]|uniref:DNA oxidative demethylase ALKBH2-like isoform X2 n=1 Tax=Antedon mediterranea TaxID=105859 RepID=UPI003AF86E7C